MLGRTQPLARGVALRGSVVAGTLEHSGCTAVLEKESKRRAAALKERAAAEKVPGACSQVPLVDGGASRTPKILDLRMSVY